MVTEVHRCEQLAQGCYTDGHGETQTHDLNYRKSNALPLSHLVHLEPCKPGPQFYTQCIPGHGASEIKLESQKCERNGDKDKQRNRQTMVRRRQIQDRQTDRLTDRHTDPGKEAAVPLDVAVRVD